MAPERRPKMLEASDTEFSWILLMICYLFIICIVYFLLEHYKDFIVGWERGVDQNM